MDQCTRVSYTQDSERTVDLSDLKLGQDKIGYYLTAKYRVETPTEQREIYIPKIRLPVDKHKVVIGVDNLIYITPHAYADIGFGRMNLDYDESDDKYYFLNKLIKSKVVEMTLEEIENKLGHKVKIVNR